MGAKTSSMLWVTLFLMLPFFTYSTYAIDFEWDGVPNYLDHNIEYTELDANRMTSLDFSDGILIHQGLGYNIFVGIPNGTATNVGDYIFFNSTLMYGRTSDTTHHIISIVFNNDFYFSDDVTNITVTSWWKEVSSQIMKDGSGFMFINENGTVFDYGTYSVPSSYFDGVFDTSYDIYLPEPNNKLYFTTNTYTINVDNWDDIRTNYNGSFKQIDLVYGVIDSGTTTDWSLDYIGITDFVGNFSSDLDNQLPSVNFTTDDSTLCFNINNQSAVLYYNLSVDDYEDDTIYYAFDKSTKFNQSVILDEDFVRSDCVLDRNAYNYIKYSNLLQKDDVYLINTIGCEAVLYFKEGSGQIGIDFPSIVNTNTDFSLDFEIELPGNTQEEQNFNIVFVDANNQEIFTYNVSVSQTNISLDLEGINIFNKTHVLDRGMVMFSLHGIITFDTSKIYTNTSSNYHSNHGSLTVGNYTATELDKFVIDSLTTDGAPYSWFRLDRVLVRGKNSYATPSWSTTNPLSNPIFINETGSAKITLYTTDDVHLWNNEYNTNTISYDVGSTFCTSEKVWSEKTPFKITRGFLRPFIEGWLSDDLVNSALWLYFVFALVGGLILFRNIKISLTLASLSSFIFALMMATSSIVIIFGVILVGTIAFMLI